MWAPVNAPRSWPNSSDSRISAGIAAQLIGRNLPEIRGEFSCRALATSSLPVPDSPTINTLERAGATRSIWRNRSSIALERPIILPNFSLSLFSRWSTSSVSRHLSRIVETRLRSSSRLTGLVK